MDKEKATKLLARELVKAGGQKFITDTAYKKHLLENALSCYPVKREEPFSFNSEVYCPYEGGYAFSKSLYNQNVKKYKEKMIQDCITVNDANYVFVEHVENLSVAENYSVLHLTDTFSFFALIGEKEVKNLKRLFYKDVDNSIIRAMDALEIKNFIYLYNRYCEDKRYFADYYRPTKRPDDFLEFVFTLPLEEQNVEANQNILLYHYSHVDFIEILTREYSNRKFFKEYFNCLDRDNKKKIFECLKSIEERNPINDSFLWSAGFKDLRLDHLELYKNDSKRFIEYFPEKKIEEKKVILKDIMECEFINEKVVQWLNENYLDLLREVGFDG